MEVSIKSLYKIFNIGKNGNNIFLVFIALWKSVFS